MYTKTIRVKSIYFNPLGCVFVEPSVILWRENADGPKKKDGNFVFLITSCEILRVYVGGLVWL